MQYQCQIKVVCIWQVERPSTSSWPVSTPSQGKSSKISSRLSGLINKINSKPTKLKGKKSLRLQVRCIREDADGNREIVKQLHGWEQPFVFFEEGEVGITFHSLLLKVIEFFFSISSKEELLWWDTNRSFQPYIWDATQTSVNLFQDIHYYFKEKGLFPFLFKTYFYLKIKPKVDFEQEVVNQDNHHFLQQSERSAEFVAAHILSIACDASKIINSIIDWQPISKKRSMKL